MVLIQSSMHTIKFEEIYLFIFISSLLKLISIRLIELCARKKGREKILGKYINQSGDACLSKPEGISYYPGPG